MREMANPMMNPTKLRSNVPTHKPTRKMQGLSFEERAAANGIRLRRPKENANLTELLKDTAKEEKGVAKLPNELLQQILANLPLYDLLRCQLVSRNWNANVLSNSTEIREKLWLHWKTEAHRGTHAVSMVSRVHPYTMRGQANQYLRTTFRLSIVPEIKAYRELLPWHYEHHPMMQHLERYMRFVNPNIVYRRRPTYYDDDELDIYYSSWNELERKTQIVEQSGSWMEMFICTPPIQSVDVAWKLICRAGYVRQVTERVEIEEGIRMKHVIGALQRQLVGMGKIVRMETLLW